MLIRVGRLRICQERVLSSGECDGIRHALEVCGAGPLEDGELPYCDHLRAQLAKLSGVSELEHQDPWHARQVGRQEVEPAAGPRNYAALVALEPTALAFPTAGARAELDPGAMIVWHLTDDSAVWLPEADSLISAAVGLWFLATWLRPELRPRPDEEITVRRPIVPCE